MENTPKNVESNRTVDVHSCFLQANNAKLIQLLLLHLEEDEKSGARRNQMKCDVRIFSNLKLKGGSCEGQWLNMRRNREMGSVLSRLQTTQSLKLQSHCGFTHDTPFLSTDKFQICLDCSELLENDISPACHGSFCNTIGSFPTSRKNTQR